MFNYSGSNCSGVSDCSENSLEEAPPPTTPLAAPPPPPPPPGGQYSDNICRDFLRNVCKRGAAQCRYRHPAGATGAVMAPVAPATELVFCHDFQNAGCLRPACRFVHCTRDQEEGWRQTGLLPVPMPDVSALPPSGGELVAVPTAGFAVMGGGVGVAAGGGEPPICMDYMKGGCKRAGKCKYRHLSTVEYEAEQLVERQRALQMAAVEAALLFEESSTCGGASTIGVHAAKKRKMAAAVAERFGLELYDSTLQHHHRAVAPPPLPPALFPSTTVVSYADYQLVEEENRFLHHKVDDLKRHIAVLVATNELLLDQNARFRSVASLVSPPPAPHPPSPSVLPSPRPPLHHRTVHHAGPHGITTMATLGHVTINGHRGEILVQPVVHHQVAPLVAPPTLGGAGGGVGDQGGAAGGSAGVSVTIVPMSMPIDVAVIGQGLAAGGGGGNMAAAMSAALGRTNMAAVGGGNMAAVAMTRSSLMTLNAGSRNMSVGNLVLSGQTIATNMSLGAPNAMSASNMEPLSMPVIAYGSNGSSLGPIIASMSGGGNGGIDQMGAQNMATMSGANLAYCGSNLGSVMVTMSGPNMDHMNGGPNLPYGNAAIGPTLVTMSGPNMEQMSAQNMAYGTQVMASMSGPNMEQLNGQNLAYGTPVMASMSGPNMEPISGLNMVYGRSSRGQITAAMSDPNMAYCGSGLTLPSVISVSNMVEALSGPYVSSGCLTQLPPPSIPPPPLPQSNSNLVSYPIMSHAQLPSSSLV